MVSLYADVDRGLITRLENLAQNGIPASAARLAASAEEAKNTHPCRFLNWEAIPHADALAQAETRYVNVKSKLALQHQQELMNEATLPRTRWLLDKPLTASGATGPATAHDYSNERPVAPPIQRPPGLRR